MEKCTSNFLEFDWYFECKWWTFAVSRSLWRLYRTTSCNEKLIPTSIQGFWKGSLDLCYFKSKSKTDLETCRFCRVANDKGQASCHLWCQLHWALAKAHGSGFFPICHLLEGLPKLCLMIWLISSSLELFSWWCLTIIPLAGQVALTSCCCTLLTLVNLGTGSCIIYRTFYFLILPNFHCKNLWKSDWEISYK